MAFLEIGFTARNMGDSSSTTTSYIVELVDCSNTTVPIAVNGYLFKTTISDAPKTGEVSVLFSNVPPNTIVPRNNKLKVTGNKNGRAVVTFEDCNPEQLIVCAENQQQSCTISNVQIGQVICN